MIKHHSDMGPAMRGEQHLNSAEPVAWHVCSVNKDGSLSLEFAAPWEELAHEHISDAILDDIDDAGSWVVRPMYSSPPQRQPLTDEQISNRLWEADWPEVMLSDFVRAKLRVFARAIERAHGIKEAP